MAVALETFLQNQYYNEEVDTMADSLLLQRQLLQQQVERESSDGDEPMSMRASRRPLSRNTTLMAARASHLQVPSALQALHSTSPSDHRFSMDRPMLSQQSVRRRRNPESRRTSSEKVTSWLDEATWGPSFMDSEQQQQQQQQQQQTEQMEQQPAAPQRPSRMVHSSKRHGDVTVLSSYASQQKLQRPVLMGGVGSGTTNARHAWVDFWGRRSSFVNLLDRHFPIINPESPGRRVWDIFIMVFVLYNAFEVPVDFSYGLPDNVALNATNYVIDLMFFFDILLNFRTSYRDHQGTLIRDTVAIAKNYGRFWLPIDIMATIPFDTIARWCGVGENNNQGQLNALAFFKTPRLLRLGRLVRLLDRVKNANVFKIVQLIGLMVLIAHWMSCIWYLMAKTAHGTHEWTFDTLHDHSTTTYYASAFYFSFLTLVGNGFVAHNNYERVFESITIIMGACFYSAVVGNMALLVANMNTVTLRHRQKETMTHDVLRYVGAPKDERLRVQKYFNYITATDHPAVEGMNFLQELPKALKEDLHGFLFRNQLKAMPLFQNCEESFITAVAVRMHVVTFTASETICAINDLGREMYIIRKGCVAVKNSTNELVSLLTVGDWFGEIASLTFGRRTANCVALSNCDLASLPTADLKVLMREFPASAETLQDAALFSLRHMQIAGRAELNDDFEDDQAEAEEEAMSADGLGQYDGDGGDDGEDRGGGGGDGRIDSGAHRRDGSGGEDAEAEGKWDRLMTIDEMFDAEVAQLQQQQQGTTAPEVHSTGSTPHRGRSPSAGNSTHGGGTSGQTSASVTWVDQMDPGASASLSSGAPQSTAPQDDSSTPSTGQQPPATRTGAPVAEATEGWLALAGCRAEVEAGCAVGSIRPPPPGAPSGRPQRSWPTRLSSLHQRHTPLLVTAALLPDSPPPDCPQHQQPMEQHQPHPSLVSALAPVAAGVHPPTRRGVMTYFGFIPHGAAAVPGGCGGPGPVAEAKVAPAGNPYIQSAPVRHYAAAGYSAGSGGGGSAPSSAPNSARGQGAPRGGASGDTAAGSAKVGASPYAQAVMPLTSARGSKRLPSLPPTSRQVTPRSARSGTSSSKDQQQSTPQAGLSETPAQPSSAAMPAPSAAVPGTQAADGKAVAVAARAVATAALQKRASLVTTDSGVDVVAAAQALLREGRASNDPVGAYAALLQERRASNDPAVPVALLREGCASNDPVPYAALASNPGSPAAHSAAQQGDIAQAPVSAKTATSVRPFPPPPLQVPQQHVLRTRPASPAVLCATTRRSTGESAKKLSYSAAGTSPSPSSPGLALQGSPFALRAGRRTSILAAEHEKDYANRLRSLSQTGILQAQGGSLMSADSLSLQLALGSDGGVPRPLMSISPNVPAPTPVGVQTPSSRGRNLLRAPSINATKSLMTSLDALELMLASQAGTDGPGGGARRSWIRAGISPSFKHRSFKRPSVQIKRDEGNQSPEPSPGLGTATASNHGATPGQQRSSEAEWATTPALARLRDGMASQATTPVGHNAATFRRSTTIGLSRNPPGADGVATRHAASSPGLRPLASMRQRMAFKEDAAEAARRQAEAEAKKQLHAQVVTLVQLVQTMAQRIEELEARFEETGKQVVALEKKAEGRAQNMMPDREASSILDIRTAGLEKAKDARRRLIAASGNNSFSVAPPGSAPNGKGLAGSSSFVMPRSVGASGKGLGGNMELLNSGGTGAAGLAGAADGAHPTSLHQKLSKVVTNLMGSRIHRFGGGDGGSTRRRGNSTPGTPPTEDGQPASGGETPDGSPSARTARRPPRRGSSYANVTNVRHDSPILRNVAPSRAVSSLGP